MDQDIKRAATALLQAHRRAEETARLEALKISRRKQEEQRQLTLLKWRLVRDARSHGMTWDEIAEVLGHASGQAMRMWFSRMGGEG